MMLKKLQSLRMRSQIIIFLIIVLSFVMGIISIANHIQRLVFHYTTSATSSSIILNSDLKQIGQISSQISYYLKSRHQRSQFLIGHLAQFIYFLSTQEQKFQTKYQLDRCVTKDEFKQREYLKNTPKFCYQIHGTEDLQGFFSDNEQRTFLLNCLSLLDHFGFLFNIYNPNIIQALDFSNFTLDSQYPFGLILKDYDPKSQPWYHIEQFRYINHIKKMNNEIWQQNFFSDVYQVQTNNNSYQFSITQSLINKDKQVFGILNTLLGVTDEYLFNIGHNVLLLNKNGQIIYNGLDKRNNISEIFYIYNQSITGFNYTDWNQIQEKAMMHKHLQQVEQFLTLFDKYSQEYVHLHCEKFEKENFTLLIYTNLSSIQMLQNQFIAIENQFDGNFQLALFVTFSSGLFFCIICISIIKLICQPLVNLNQQISSHILTLGNNINKKIFKLFTLNDNSFDLLAQLNQKFQNFYDVLHKNENKKCEQCILFEKMKFNLKECNIDLKEIKLIIQKVPNNVESISINDFLVFLKQSDDQLKTI